MHFLEVVFLSSPASFYFTLHTKIVAKHKATGPPHVIKQCLVGVNNGMFPVKYLCSNKSTFCVTKYFFRITRQSQI